MVSNHPRRSSSFPVVPILRQQGALTRGRTRRSGNYTRRPSRLRWAPAAFTSRRSERMPSVWWLPNDSHERGKISTRHSRPFHTRSGHLGGQPKSTPLWPHGWHCRGSSRRYAACRPQDPVGVASSRLERSRVSRSAPFSAPAHGAETVFRRLPTRRIDPLRVWTARRRRRRMSVRRVALAAEANRSQTRCWRPPIEAGSA